MHIIRRELEKVLYSQRAFAKGIGRANYLRKNFTAIVSEKTIPFSDELEHTRAYLNVEQVQFEDSIQVEYDIL